MTYLEMAFGVWNANRIVTVDSSRSHMADAAQGTPQEFWSPPSPLVGHELAASDLSPAMAEVCPRCSSEFLLGSRFCHTCGGTRPLAISPEARADATAVAHLWER